MNFIRLLLAYCYFFALRFISLRISQVSPPIIKNNTIATGKGITEGASSFNDAPSLSASGNEFAVVGTTLYLFLSAGACIIY
jgi:hypothetical protein